jgi:uncharacterized protein YpuA (DUF1002 family)
MEVFSKDETKIQEILQELQQSIKLILKNKNGNHVVQKCFEFIHYSKLEFIIKEAHNSARFYNLIFC